MTNIKKVILALDKSFFLSEWENVFLLELSDKINRGAQLSIKEQDRLDIIYFKIEKD